GEAAGLGERHGDAGVAVADPGALVARFQKRVHAPRGHRRFADPHLVLGRLFVRAELAGASVADLVQVEAIEIPAEPVELAGGDGYLEGGVWPGLAAQVQGDGPAAGHGPRHRTAGQGPGALTWLPRVPCGQRRYVRVEQLDQHVAELTVGLGIGPFEAHSAEAPVLVAGPVVERPSRVGHADTEHHARVAERERV